MSLFLRAVQKLHSGAQMRLCFGHFGGEVGSLLWGRGGEFTLGERWGGRGPAYCALLLQVLQFAFSILTCAHLRMGGAHRKRSDPLPLQRRVGHLLADTSFPGTGGLSYYSLLTTTTTHCSLSLLTAHYSLLTPHYQLLTTHPPLPITHFQLQRDSLEMHEDVLLLGSTKDVMLVPSAVYQVRVVRVILVRVH